MHPQLYPVAVVWCLVLVGALALSAIRARSTVDKLLALDTLSIVFIEALAVLALHRGRPAYLDVALMLALVAFAQTLAGVQYARRGRTGS